MWLLACLPVVVGSGCPLIAGYLGCVARWSEVVGKRVTHKAGSERRDVEGEGKACGVPSSEANQLGAVPGGRTGDIRKQKQV